MAILALTNAFVYGGSHDYTGDSNEVRLAAEAEPLDKTNMRSGGWREFAQGVKTSTLTGAGMAQFDSDTTDAHQFSSLGSGTVFTAGPTESEGSVAYMLQALQYDFSYGGSHGELAPYTLNGSCSDGVGIVRGSLLKAMGTVSATGALGTAVQLGAASSTQYLYGTLHLFGTAGTTITVVLESDSDNTFASATTRITFGPLTATGGTWGTRVAGAITDDWYRLRVTAITGTWSVAGAAGVQ